MRIPRIMIAAASSGSGKTMVSCALMEALKQKGKIVSACKCGPDYIDPMFHREVLGIDSENLDLFFTEEKMLQKIFLQHVSGSDIAVMEGVMGYYDGMTFGSETASSYEVAKTLKTPVILVVGCRGMSLSVLAVIKGMMEFRKDSQIRGIILNRVSSMLYPRMKKMIEKGLREMGLEAQVVGYIPEDDVFGLESRHLGLVTPDEISGLKEKMKRAGEMISQTVELGAVMSIAENAPEMDEDKEVIYTAYHPKKTIKIGVARDEAFCFYYKENLRLLEKMGCELIPFSPIRDEKLPEGIRGLLLGGGYPEEYAKELAENQSMRESVKAWILEGSPCLAECGGFLYLHEQMQGSDGIRYPMAGVIAAEAVRKERLVRFGYVQIEAEIDGNYLKKGEQIRGHEFHYWDSSDNGRDCLAVKPDGTRKWNCIHMRENLFAGYPHLYYCSNPVIAERFVDACRKKEEKSDIGYN